MSAIYGKEMYFEKDLLLDTYENYKENLETGTITGFKLNETGDGISYSNGKNIVYFKSVAIYSKLCLYQKKRLLQHRQ